MKIISKGYTLIELMVALTLGLIIAAAAVQLLISGQSTLTFQKAIENVQDNAIFGVNFITADIRQTNFDFDKRKMSNNGLSGLIVKKENYPTTMVTTGLPLSGTAVGKTFADSDSDILVIQYRPAQVNGFNCEGKKIETTDNIIVQKYFLRKDESSKTGDLVLACAAGSYDPDADVPKLVDLTNTSIGQVILQRVDQFKVLVGVIDSNGNFGYLTLKEFESSTNDSRPVSLQIGVIVRSVDNAGTNTVLPTSYTLFNLPYKISNPTGVSGKFLRIPIEQTVALRNAMGDEK